MGVWIKEETEVLKETEYSQLNNKFHVWGFGISKSLETNSEK